MTSLSLIEDVSLSKGSSGVIVQKLPFSIVESSLHCRDL